MLLPTSEAEITEGVVHCIAVHPSDLICPLTWMVTCRPIVAGRQFLRIVNAASFVLWFTYGVGQQEWGLYAVDMCEAAL